MKAELSKLGDAPRSYAERLKAPSSLEGEMNIDEAAVGLSNLGLSSRLSLTDRFEKIQGARPGGPPSADDGKTLKVAPKQ